MAPARAQPIAPVSPATRVLPTSIGSLPASSLEASAPSARPATKPLSGHNNEQTGQQLPAIQQTDFAGARLGTTSGKAPAANPGQIARLHPSPRHESSVVAMNSPAAAVSRKSEWRSNPTVTTKATAQLSLTVRRSRPSS